MDRRLTQRALELLDAHRSFVRATVVETNGSVPGKRGASMLLTDSGECFGTVGGAALEERVKALARTALEERRGGLHHFELQAWKPGGVESLCGGTVDIALEYVAARPHLLLWGGGHVAHALASILPTLEYDYSVADDRAEWIGVERFASADRRELVDAGQLWERFAPSQYTHLYVLGYDAKKDIEVLARSVGEFPNFIGFISSAAKRAHVFAELRRRGLGEDRIARIRAPIGLPIGAESPAEIAVSIVAELVRGQHPETKLAAAARAPEGVDVASRTA